MTCTGTTFLPVFVGSNGTSTSGSYTSFSNTSLSDPSISTSTVVIIIAVVTTLFLIVVVLVVIAIVTLVILRCRQHRRAVSCNTSSGRNGDMDMMIRELASNDNNFSEKFSQYKEDQKIPFYTHSKSRSKEPYSGKIEEINTRENAAGGCVPDSTSGAMTYINAVVIKPDHRPLKPNRVKRWGSHKPGKGASKITEATEECEKFIGKRTMGVRCLDDNMAGGVADDTYQGSTARKVPTLIKSSTAKDPVVNKFFYYNTRRVIEPAIIEEPHITDHIYATPEPSAATNNFNPSTVETPIYKNFHSESLQPSLFIQELEREESRKDLCPYASIYTVPLKVTSQERALEITKENIRQESTLGSGNFGKVVLAKTVRLSQYDMKIGESRDNTITVPVAVKMLKTDASESSKKQFEKEYRFMFRLNHPNVIRLLGICLTETPFIMMEYMEKGDLNQILQKYHKIINGTRTPRHSEIKRQTLVHICTQIASAMNYLASNNFIHRDLATRNCLVGENFHVKVSDFGMSRNLYDSHYYMIKGQAILPIRWMATECFYGKFSAKTDVWAFGVTMWEIFMLAKHEPYSEMTDKTLIWDAVRGPDRTILSCPKKCSSNVYEIMKCCWAHESSQRATFDQLYGKLLSLDHGY